MLVTNNTSNKKNIFSKPSGNSRLQVLTLNSNTLDWKVLTHDEHTKRRNSAYKYLIP